MTINDTKPILRFALTGSEIHIGEVIKKQIPILSFYSDFTGTSIPVSGNQYDIALEHV